MFDIGADMCGSLFQYKIFWDVAYGTTDPNVVKVGATEGDHGMTQYVTLL